MTELKVRIVGEESFPGLRATAEGALSSSELQALNNERYILIPGFCDVHVHLREPGFSYKETILSGTEAAARGGYTVVCPMPNLNPVPDSAETLQVELDIIEKTARVRVYPYASITKREKGQELSDMEALSPKVVAFSDDGVGVQTEEMMKQAMIKAKELNKLIVAHCEDNSLLVGGYIHQGEYAEAHGHIGISSESEWVQIARDVRLSEETGCGYHVCHISTKEGVQIIREAKKRGANVTCEVTPHHLLLDEWDIQEDGKFKMNPPLRSKEDREALIEGIQDGTIDIIATDHAPHSAEEKSKGLKGSAFGVVGLETAFPLLYTELVKKNVISMERLIELLAVNPRERFGIPADDAFSIWDMEDEYPIDPKEFLSQGKSTPFEGRNVFGRNKATVLNGEIVYLNI